MFQHAMFILLMLSQCLSDVRTAWLYSLGENRNPVSADIDTDDLRMYIFCGRSKFHLKALKAWRSRPGRCLAGCQKDYKDVDASRTGEGDTSFTEGCI